ncbi:hypothetical protein [Streptomyces sp. NPDC058861]
MPTVDEQGDDAVALVLGSLKASATRAGGLRTAWVTAVLRLRYECVR